MRPSAIVDYTMATLSGDHVAALRVLHRELWYWDGEYRRLAEINEQQRKAGVGTEWGEEQQAKAWAEVEAMSAKFYDHFPQVIAVPGYATLDPEDLLNRAFPTPDERERNLQLEREVAEATAHAEDYSGRGGFWEQLGTKLTTEPLAAPREMFPALWGPPAGGPGGEECSILDFVCHLRPVIPPLAGVAGAGTAMTILNTFRAPWQAIVLGTVVGAVGSWFVAKQWTVQQAQQQGAA